MSLFQLQKHVLQLKCVSATKLNCNIQRCLGLHPKQDGWSDRSQTPFNMDHLRYPIYSKASQIFI